MTPFLTPLRIALIAVLAVATIVGLALIPAGTQLPIHWNLFGEPDLFAPREVALLIPAVMVAVLWVVFAIVGRIARPAELTAGRHVTSAAISLVIGLAVVIEVATVLLGLGYAVGIAQVIAVAMAILLLVLGNALPKSQPNSYAGIRIPTTLRDPANWQATHRLGGALSILGGLVLLAAAFLVPASSLFFWLLGCVFVPMLAATLYSLVYARRHGT